MVACARSLALLEELGDHVSRLLISDVACGAQLCRAALMSASLTLYANTTAMADRERACELEEECEQRVAELKAEDKLLEAQRLQQRTDYDLELLETMGFCTGIENYSRHLDGRRPGEPPFTLIDYFPKELRFHLGCIGMTGNGYFYLTTDITYNFLISGAFAMTHENIEESISTVAL